MYGTIVNADGTLTSYLSYGDNYPLSFKVYDDVEKTIPSDLTGKEFTLGVETVKGVHCFEVDAVVNDNLITFNIFYDVYGPISSIVEGTTYKFDYWEKTERATKIPMSSLEFRAVAHRPEEVEV